MQEREIEMLLRDGVRQLGGKAYKWVSPGNAGVPDRIVVLPGGTVHFVELKNDGGRLTRLQKVQQANLRGLDSEVVTLYGADAVRAYLAQVKELIGNGVEAAPVSKVLH